VLAYPSVVPVATFLGAFFIVHCIFVIARNGLYGMRIVKRLDLAFWLRAGGLALAAAATAGSIAVLDGSTLRIFASVVLAAGSYLEYVYARRIRAECTSLSQIHADIADTRRCIETLNTIGRQPITSSVFPFFPYRSKALFISYMHDSKWSSETAAMIHRSTAEHGFVVFLDQSSIASGSLWRQSLLRAISECGWFIAVLEDEVAATDWIVAESAYAALLRKNVGKPRILIVVRNAEGITKLQHGPFGMVYRDIFQLPRGGFCVGAAILATGDAGFPVDLLLRALKEVRPMCLLR